MATVSTSRIAAAVSAALSKLQRYRTAGYTGRADGVYLLKFTKTLTAAEVADFDAAGDFLEIMTFPSNCRLKSVTVDVPDMDAHATPTITLDLMVASTVLVNDSTAGQAGTSDIEWVQTGAPLDVSSSTLKLKIEDAPATAQTSYGAFTVYAEVYFGTPVSV